MSDTPLNRVGWRVAQFLRERPVLGAAMLLALVLAVYTPALEGEFVWDDATYVTGDERLETLGGLGRIWTEISGPDYKHQYYPMTSSAFWLQHQVWGEVPAGYHLVNVLLHAVNALLLWRLLCLLRVPGAWAAAAIFALHPVQVPSVAWIAELKNVLSCFFFLGALHAFVLAFGLDVPSADEPEREPRSRRLRVGLYAAGLAWFLAALLSKTATGLLPAVLLILIWWKRGPSTWAAWKRDLLAVAPLLVMAVGFMAMTSVLETHHRAHGEAYRISFDERMLIAGRAVWFSAAKLVWPSGLTVVYPRWTASAWMIVFPATLIAILGVLWKLRGRIGRAPFAGAAYFAVALAPLSLVNVGFHRYSYVADHWQYWSSMGLIALVVGGIAAATRHAEASLWRRVAPAGLATAVLVTLCVMTWSRAHVFRGPVELWSDAAARNPDARVAHYNLGVALQMRERHAEAADAFAEAVRADPMDALSRNNYGVALRHLHRPDEAISEFLLAISIDPDFGLAHLNLAAALHVQGHYEAAVRHYDHATALRPDLELMIARRRDLAAQTLPSETVQADDAKEGGGFRR